jgi:uncharacterized membrane protein
MPDAPGEFLFYTGGNVALRDETMSENSDAQGSKPSRLFAPDALRGLLMALMALDHASLFVAHKHPTGEMWGGPFPAYYDTLTFLTRWVTHLCAPGFFLLMGFGMVLLAHAYRQRGWSRWAITRHFLIRGAVLIVLKLLVVNRAWELAPGGWGIQLYIGVLFALGACMILGSLLLWLEPIYPQEGVRSTYLLGVTLVLVIGTELLVPDPSQWGTRLTLPRLLLLVPGGITGSGGRTVLWSYYPVLAWLKLVTFGMVFGCWLLENHKNAFSRAWKLGLAFLAAFVVLRYLGGFGNIRPRMGNTWVDFLNLVKYPPSIVFTLMTTGINLILLGLLGRVRQPEQQWLRPLTVLGQTPLFFYVVHLFLYAALGRLLTPQGTSIAAMYPYWLLGLAMLYPLCLWYGRFKARQPVGSIWRLF